MQKILVPISAYLDDANSLDYARYLALKSQAHITILYSRSRKWIQDSLDQGGIASLPPESEEVSSIKNRKVLRKLGDVVDTLKRDNIDFTFKYVPSLTIQGVSRECKEGAYDFVVLSTLPGSRIMGYLQRTYLSMIIGEIDIPVLMVPGKKMFSGIESITYTVDLTDYDPSIVQQVKSLATLFDARLNIVHVNRNEEEQENRGQYLNSLEQTITDTLDYPKVNYKFFDHKDAFSGIKKFVDGNNNQVVAMISRSKFTWRELFRGTSLTRRMVKESSVPLIAFNKVKIEGQ
ncbi:MAG: hypothetical protein AAF694_12580 [Bacteroidota bacterium]